MKFIVIATFFCALFLYKGESRAVCMDWVDLVWNLMVLGEETDGLGEARAATVSDMRRMFTLMDMDADALVEYEEFGQVWKECSFMTDNDTRKIFDMFASASDGSDRRYITLADVTAAWQQYFKKPTLTKQEFSQAWQERIMPQLPNKGCGIASPADAHGRSLLCLRYRLGGFF